MSGIIGRKELVGGLLRLLEDSGLNPELVVDTGRLEVGRGEWKPGVAVKCADIGRNTGSEGGSLGLCLTS